MKIEETKCNLCYELTEFGFIYYDKTIPICKKCIIFIKSLKLKEYSL